MINLFTMAVQQMVLIAEQVQKWEAELLRMHLRNLSLITEQAAELSEKEEHHLIKGAAQSGELIRSSARSLHSTAERGKVAFQSHSRTAQSKARPRRVLR